jgi:endonuclease G
MKKILLFLVTFNIYAQDVIILKHTLYTSHYSISKHYPIYVEYTLTSDMISCNNPLVRFNDFKADPLAINQTNTLDNYRGSGTDRGHMMSYQDNACQSQSIANECFYMSNMAPQYHELNAGDWEELEKAERKLAKDGALKIWAGNIGELKKIGKVSIPSQCWKVIYFKSNNTYKAYLFNNDKSLSNGYVDNEISLAKIKLLTSLTFIP